MPHNLFRLVLTLSLLCLSPLAKAGENCLPPDSQEKVSWAWREIKNKAVSEPEDKNLVEGCIVGMTAAVDPHSVFIPNERFQQLVRSSKNIGGAVGLELEWADGMVRVVAAVEGAPAEVAGIMPGDALVQVDNLKVVGKQLEEVTDLLRGAIGSTVRLTVIREDELKPRSFVLTREGIVRRGVRAELLEEGIGYVRLGSFNEGIPKNLKDALNGLFSDKSKPRGLILDLRNCPGGLLDVAVRISNNFLKSGQEITTIRSKGVEEQRYNSSNRYPDWKADVPLVVLVNEQTVAGAEIVAGALQDHKRAIVVGRNTFGRGTIQTIIPLPGYGAMKLTTGHFSTPSGNKINGIGITPDVILAARTKLQSDRPSPQKDAEVLAALTELKRQIH
jgi:carboxyl-terminal processing protease